VFTEAVQNLEHLMVQAFNRQIGTARKSILIPLSGGLDSRWMVALADEADMKPIKSFTMGPENSEDVQYASNVAAELNIDHKIFDISPADIWNDAQRFSFVADGMSMIYGPIQNFSPFRHYSRITQIVMMPQMCDVLFGSSLYRKQLNHLMLKNEWDTEAENLFIEHFNLSRNENLKRIFNEKYLDDICYAYRLASRQYIEKDKHPMYCYFRMLMNEHGRRGTLGGNLASNLFFTTRMPSYDNDLVEFAFNSPLIYRINQRLYRGAFSKRFPGLAAIPRQGSNLPISINDFQLNMQHLRGRIINRAKTTPFGPIIRKFKRWNRPEYVSYARWFRTDLQSDVKNLILDARTLDRDLYRWSGLENTLNEHFSGQKDHHRIIWQIVNLELFMREFID
jgi:asparagine synthase (glutamine-hydrolysing)